MSQDKLAQGGGGGGGSIRKREEQPLLRADSQGKLEEQLRVACMRGDLSTLELLLGGKPRSEVNQGFKDGWTPVMVAANSGHPTLVKYLLSKGADPNKCREDGYSPLMVALTSAKGKVLIQQCAQLLVDSGANVNSKGDDGVTPLLLAVKENRIPVVDLLVFKGAEVTGVKDKEGRSVAEIAKEKGYDKILMTLNEKAGKTTPPKAQVNPTKPPASPSSPKPPMVPPHPNPTSTQKPEQKEPAPITVLPPNTKPPSQVPQVPLQPPGAPAPWRRQNGNNKPGGTNSEKQNKEPQGSTATVNPTTTPPKEVESVKKLPEELKKPAEEIKKPSSSPTPSKPPRLISTPSNPSEDIKKTQEDGKSQPPPTTSGDKDAIKETKKPDQGGGPKPSNSLMKMGVCLTLLATLIVGAVFVGSRTIKIKRG